MASVLQRAVDPVITYKGFRFLILPRPTNINMCYFLLKLLQHKVKYVVRLSEASYRTDELEAAGIQIKNLAFENGTSPAPEFVDEWFRFLKNVVKEDPNACVAVHCLTGLGRGPTMVALALIELGLEFEDAVQMVRGKRPGAFNPKQMAFLRKYQPQNRLKKKRNCTVQ